jgi:hypothetical protein
MARVKASIVVSAGAASVWQVVSDVTRTPEWSPECVSIMWLGHPDPIGPGEHFLGRNRAGRVRWEMECVVDEVVEATRFQFHTVAKNKPRTRWGYELRAIDATTTELTEFYERLRPPPIPSRVASRLALGDRTTRNRANLIESLERIKAICERSAQTAPPGGQLGGR